MHTYYEVNFSDTIDISSSVCFHTIGFNWITRGRTHSVVTIPKNCSTTLKDIAPELNWSKHYDAANANANEYIVILRDPVKRWVSGAAEYLIRLLLRDRPRQTEIGDIFKQPLFRKMLSDNAQFDMHTTPQAVFLQGLPLERTKFFYMDNNDPVADVLNYMGTPATAPVQNTAEDTDIKRELTLHLKEMMTNIPMRKRIEKQTWCDKILLETVNFENY